MVTLKENTIEIIIYSQNPKSDLIKYQIAIIELISCVNKNFLNRFNDDGLTDITSLLSEMILTFEYCEVDN